MPASESTPKRRSAPPVEVIIDAAAELFGMHGYANTTMQDVADKLGIAKPTLYVHAKSKMALLEGVYDQVLTDGDRALEGAEEIDDPRERLRTFVTLWTEMTLRRRPLIYAFFASETELPEHLSQRYRAWSAETARRIRAMIIYGQEAGVFRPEMDATTVAFAVVSATQWTARWWREGGPQSLEAVIETHTMLIEGGLLKR
jgi:AcrR family transcriptional regulator